MKDFEVLAPLKIEDARGSRIHPAEVWCEDFRYPDSPRLFVHALVVHKDWQSIDKDLRKSKTFDWRVR